MNIKTAKRTLAIILTILLTLGVFGVAAMATPTQTVRIGVTPVSADNIGSILTGMNLPFTVISTANLANPEVLSQFDVIFINCGSHNNSAAAQEAIRNFVYQGGLVYASDRAQTMITAAFPGMFSTFLFRALPVIQNASVLRMALGNRQTVDINTRPDIQVVRETRAEIESRGGFVYIEGNIPNTGLRPLAISFPHGQGGVFFVSFHTHAQETEGMREFLGFVVNRIMFDAQGSAVISLFGQHGFVTRYVWFPILNPGQSTSGTFDVGNPFSDGFSMAFSGGPGVLTLTAPNGQTFSTTQNPASVSVGNMTVTRIARDGAQGLAVRNPIPGQWSYTLTSNSTEQGVVFTLALGEIDPNASWWSNLPAWLQWIFRWILFGWIWM